MGLLEDLIKNKETLILKGLEFLEGKEASTRLKLDGMQFSLGDTTIKLSGEVDVTVVRQPKKKKK